MGTASSQGKCALREKTTGMILESLCVCSFNNHVHKVHLQQNHTQHIKFNLCYVILDGLVGIALAHKIHKGTTCELSYGAIPLSPGWSLASSHREQHGCLGPLVSDGERRSQQLFLAVLEQSQNLVCADASSCWEQSGMATHGSQGGTDRTTNC